VEDVPVNTPLAPGPSLEALQAAFLDLVLPKVVSHGRCYFRHVRCPHRKEELLAEMRGLAWLWFVRLAGRGKDVTGFVSALATYAARAANSGRRVCGQERSKDALSPSAQRRHGFRVSALPEVSTLSDNPLSEALADNTRTPPDEQCAFRLDFPAWRATHAERDRRLLDDLMVGGRTLEVAGKYGLSPGRVSQLRRGFLLGWRRYISEPPPVA
jgi:hypothetical protein